MIRLKTQAKTRRKSSKKENYLKKLSFNFASQSVVIFLVVAFFGFEIFLAPTATADQLPITKPTNVTIASNLLVSPTPEPTISLPLMEDLSESLKPEITSEAAKIGPSQAEDYCMNVPVVMYHHVQPLDMSDLLGHKALTLDSTIFDEQMQYLSDQGYKALAAEDLVNALETRQPLPEKSIIITIDDGYDDNYTYAFMSAKKHHMIMNFMIPTGLIGKSGYMNWDHLKEMHANPYVRIYNHTTSHAPLGLIDKDKITMEVKTANEQLAAELGLDNKIVTYPYGSYDDEAVEDLKELGMTAAFTTDMGTEQCLSKIMTLPRLRIGNAPMSDYGF